MSQKQASAALPYYQQVIDIAREQGRSDVEQRMKKIMEDLAMTESEKEEDTSLDLSPRPNDSVLANGESIY